jgi:drug/metabolite transporter (DMT)-like permease
MQRLSRRRTVLEANLSIIHFALALFTVLGMSIGQILLKIAAQGMRGHSLTLQLVLFDKYLVLALFVYAASMVLWVALLRHVSLSLAYPILALAFVFVPTLEHLILSEPMRPQTVLGAMIICAGVWVSVVRA